MNINTEDLISFLLNKEGEKKRLELERGERIFLQYIKEFKRPATYTFYSNKLKLLNTFFSENNIFYVNQIDTKLIDKYIKLQKGRIKNQSINKSVGVIKYLLSYLYKKDLIDKVELKNDKLPNDGGRYKMIEKEELELILQHIETYPIQSRLFFYILASTGIRRTELTMLKISNINWKDNNIFLDYTKNHRARHIFLSQKTMKLLKEHLDLTQNTFYIFESNKKPINASIIDHVFHKIKKDLNIEISPHVLRHTYATTLLDNGVDMESIRLLLGHCDYSIISRYLHLKTDKLATTSLLNNPIQF